jgi:hypothetical protein
MGRLFSWIINTIVFYLKASIFLAVLLLLLLFGTVHAAICGGPIMPDDMWWLCKVLLLILLPVGLSIALRGKAPLLIGFAASALLACSFSWGTYTHAPQFWESKSYSVENGKLVIPEGNRELLMRDCGSISHEGMKDTCKTIVFCQDYDALAYERMGCEELLTKKTSPALLDLALQERRGFEQDQRRRGE